MESAHPPRLSTFYAGLGNHTQHPHPPVVRTMVPRLSTFYKAQGNHRPHPHPQVVSSMSPGTVKITNAREEFQFPEGPEKAEDWSEARKSVPRGETLYDRPYHISKENARTWGNILAKYNSYENVVEHIRGRENLTYKSKEMLGQSAAHMFEPEERKSLRYLMGLDENSTRKGGRRNKSSRSNRSKNRKTRRQTKW